MEATPRPWKMIHEARNHFYNDPPADDYRAEMQSCRYICGPSNDSDFVADLITSRHPRGDANAALVVRAVNAHDDLVAALKEARDALTCVQARSYLDDDVINRRANTTIQCVALKQAIQARAAIDAALAKAEGR